MKHKSKRCSTGHGTGAVMPVPLHIRLARDKAQRDAKRLNSRRPRRMSEREEAEAREQLGAYMDFLGIRRGSMEQPTEQPTEQAA